MTRLLHSTFAERVSRELTAAPFVLALALLGANDWLLKPAFHSWWTGKLSDVAGLYAFAICAAAVSPSGRRAVCLAIAAAFLAWKSPLADPMIAAWNSAGVFRITRVIDYTDWLALVVLLPAARATRGTTLLSGHRARRAFAFVAGSVAVLLFSATSVAYRTTVTPAAHAFVIPADAATVLFGLRALHFWPYSSRQEHNGPYHVWLEVRYPPERWLPFEADLHDVGRDSSQLQMLELTGPIHGPVPPTPLLDSLVDAQILQPLAVWLNDRAAEAKDSSSTRDSTAPPRVPPSAPR